MEWVHLLPESQKEALRRAARDMHTCVLISGAPGTGKGQIARWIHLNGPHAKGSMLIAHRKKALAEQIREGSEGRDAALIIEEIGQWPMGDQRAVLNQIEAVKNDPSGHSLRIIATTDQNLEKRAQAGLFNPELLKALSNVRIEMPALSQRQSEFETITRTLVAELASEMSRQPPTLNDAAWERLKSYDWPGNLRELRNVLRMALSTNQASVLGPDAFPEFGYDRTDFHATRDAFEKTYLEELMKTFAGDRSKVASVTGLSALALEAKIKKHGLA